ncbi:GyrI-like domain-containing protein [Nocardioides sp. NBC_00850]|uniref:GyrI-like domain-containing protein n=1 Tax=Nocardioides sp. NBC_00850 TaxID=2976001 RepID=UPI003868F363|nr:GyrI-like domain-containing protein [Nocardioides sp. NBC_00850]
MKYDVTIEHENGRFLAVHAFEGRPDEMAEMQGQAFGTVAEHLAAIGVPIEGAAVSCYEMSDDSFHVSSGFVVGGPIAPGDGVESLRLPDVDVASTTHIGPYNQLGMAYEALKEGAEAKERHVDASAIMWEEYLTGPDSPPDEITTVVHWPLEPAGA